MWPSDPAKSRSMSNASQARETKSEMTAPSWSETRVRHGPKYLTQEETKVVYHTAAVFALMKVATA